MDKHEKIVEELNKHFNYGKLTMDRVPKKSLTQFITLANEEFCKDYGFTLKHLLDVYFGILNKGTEHIESAVIDLNDRVETLENVKKEQTVEKKNVRTMLNGKVIRKC